MPIIFSIIIGSFADLIPLWLGLRVFRNLNKHLMILLAFFILTVAFNAVFIFLSFYKLSNLHFLNLFALVQYSFFIYVFSGWQTKKKLRMGLQFSILLSWFFWMGFKIFGMSFGDLLYFTVTIASVILVIVSVDTLLSLNRDNSITIFRYSSFWIAGGVLIYFAGNMLLVAFSIFVKVGSLWLIHVGLNIIANICYAGGFISQSRLKIGGSSLLEPQLSSP